MKIRFTARFFAGVILCCAPVFAAGQQPDWDPNAPVPADSSFRTGRLDNGLTYFIKANRRPEKRAELRLVVNAGSVLEDDNQQGLAHFTEHMAFNGTVHFKKQELVDYLESIGMKFGPEVNASTGFDETVYELRVPTDSLPAVEKAMLILEDWAHGLSLEEGEIDKERGVVVEEWRLGRGAEARMRDRQFPVLLHGSRYAERLPIGRKAVIDTFHNEDLRRFYRDWYRPDLMAVIAVGDFDPQMMETMIRGRFSGLAMPCEPKVRSEMPVPDHEETLFAIASDPEAVVTSVSVYVKKPLEPAGTLGDYRRSLVADLYDGMMNERLFELTKKPDPPFIYGLAGTGRMLRTKGVSVLTATVRENGAVRGLEALLAEVRRVRQFGFTPTELERRKADMLRGLERSYSEREKTESAVFAGAAADHFLEGEPMPDALQALALGRLLLPAISLEDVNRLAGQSAAETNRVILVTSPQKEGIAIPTESDLLSAYQRVETAELPAYDDRVPEGPLLDQTPKPGTIVKTRTFPSIGTTEWTLSNGARVVLKPTDFKNDQVLFRAFRFGGNSIVPDSDYVAAVTAETVLEECGWGGFSAVELEKKLAGKIAGLSPFIAALSQGVTGNASPRDLEILFQLVRLQFASPRKDTAAFRAYQSRLKDSIQNRSLRPESALTDTLQAVLTCRHFRGRPMTAAMLDEMDLDASLRIHRERFADASGFTFFLAGAFDTEDIKPMVLAYLGGLPSTGSGETWKDVRMTYPRGVIEKTLRRGIEPKARVVLVFSGTYEWNPKNNAAFNSMTDALDIRLREVIREDMGGTYGVSVSGGVKRIPRPEYGVTVSFGCSPGRVDELARAVLSQIDSLKTGGPSARIMQKVQEAQRREFEISMKENGFWIGRLMQHYVDGQDPRGILEFPGFVRKTNAKAVQKAARRWFDMRNRVKVVLLPETDGTP